MIIEKVNSVATDLNETALKKAAKKEFSERQLAEIAALKAQHEAEKAALVAKVEEINLNLNKLKESVQNILKKIKEDFKASKTETGTSIEGINKEITEMKAKIVS